MRSLRCAATLQHRHVGSEKDGSANGGSRRPASVAPARPSCPSVQSASLPLRDFDCCESVCSEVRHLQRTAAIWGIHPERAGADAAAVPGVTRRSLEVVGAFRIRPPRLCSSSIRGALLVPFWMCCSGLGASCLQMARARIWTSGTSLSRCSSPTPKVLLPAKTRCSNPTQI